MLFELIIFVYLCLMWHRKQNAIDSSEQDERERGLLVNSVMYTGVNQDHHDSIMPTSKGLAAKEEALKDESKIIKPVNFSDTYLSFGPWTQKLLCFTRIASFLFFSVVGIVINHDVHHNWGWWFFTSWNIFLLCVFYFFASIASIIGLCSKKPSEAQIITMNVNSNTLAILVNILYEVTGSSALLVSTVAFTLLDPHFEFWNMTIHLFNTCSIIIELILNRMEVKKIHIIFTVLWCMIYIAFIWTMVISGTVEEWPYPFLDTSTWECFLWYNGLFLIGIFFYYIFDKISGYKLKRHRSYLRYHDEQQENADTAAFYYDPLDDGVLA